MSGHLILALDLGSSGCKGALIDSEGRRVRSARVAFAPPGGKGAAGWIEQSPCELWDGVVQTIQGLCVDPQLREIAALSISAQMGSHLLVDASGTPLTGFVSWMDSRAKRESQELEESFSQNQRNEEFGAELQMVPSWPVPRLKWWRKNQPALLDKARFLIQPKDWMIWKLSGVWRSDLSSLRGVRNQVSGAVSERMKRWAGFDEALILPVAPPDTIAGTLLPAVARELNLSGEIPVLVGWNDLAAATLGASGFPSEAMGVDITGTSEHLGVTYPGTGIEGKGCAFSDIPLTTSQRLNYGVTSSSGRTLRWYWSTFRRREETAAGYGELEAEALSASPGAEGLVCLPCLEGERAPWQNASTRGAFFGIASHHRSAHFSRSVLEGIALTLRSIHQQLGVSTSFFRSVGGGSAMSAWNQIKADVLQTPFVTLEDPEGGCLGAAILASKALGWSCSLKDAGQAMIRLGRVYEPEPALAGHYAELHDRFERTYRALEPLFPGVAAPSSPFSLCNKQ